MKLNEIFDKLWKNYTLQNQSALQVYNLFSEKGEKVINDHIAFRTFNDKRVNIDVLSKLFIDNGYIEKGQYNFEEKKLFAKHFELPGDKYAPRVFISELLVEQFSPFLQETIKNALNSVPNEIYSNADLLFNGRPWENISYSTYEKLRNESEYAAWLYVYGYCANHFTISIDNLKKYNDIKAVNQLLKDNGFKLNTSGGEIKGTPQELLEQSSILAEIVKINFSDGEYNIPACYYEFAKRYPDSNGELYSGFIAKSADKIFESTNYYSK